MEIIIYSEDGKEIARGPIKTSWQKMKDKFSINFYLTSPLDVTNDGTPTSFDLMDNGKCFYTGKDRLHGHIKVYADGPLGFGRDTIDGFNFKMEIMKFR